MKKNEWIDSLDFKAWSIAYEIKEPELQIKAIIDLVNEYLSKIDKEG